MDKIINFCSQSGHFEEWVEMNIKCGRFFENRKGFNFFLVRYYLPVYMEIKMMIYIPVYIIFLFM